MHQSNYRIKNFIIFFSNVILLMITSIIISIEKKGSIIDLFPTISLKDQTWILIISINAIITISLSLLIDVNVLHTIHKYFGNVQNFSYCTFVICFSKNLSNLMILFLRIDTLSLSIPLKLILNTTPYFIVFLSAFYKIIQRDNDFKNTLILYLIYLGYGIVMSAIPFIGGLYNVA